MKTPIELVQVSLDNIALTLGDIVYYYPTFEEQCSNKAYTNAMKPFVESIRENLVTVKENIFTIEDPNGYLQVGVPKLLCHLQVFFDATAKEHGESQEYFIHHAGVAFVSVRDTRKSPVMN